MQWLSPGQNGAAGDTAVSAHSLVLSIGSIPSTSGGSDRSGVMGDDGRRKVITDRLDEVLDEVDMEITSQRQIINKLAEELGEDVLEHKALIKVFAQKWVAVATSAASGLQPLCRQCRLGYKVS